MGPPHLGDWKALPDPDTALGPEIVSWYQEHGRSFPWRQTTHPFRIVCTEIMLQRTRAPQVARLFREHVSAWEGPGDVLDLGRAGVEALFEQLGLLWRADYFWKLQKELREKWAGSVPRDRADLEALPGIGRYAAAATRIYAFGASETAVDANVLRILGRVYGIDFPDHARRSRRVLSWASAHCPGPGEAARAFNWGLVDLGSLVCSPEEPQHGECPVADRCWLAG